MDKKSFFQGGKVGMKKFWLATGILSLVILPSIVTIQANLSAEESTDVTPDAQRDRELLEIWKDHVKTLTKERNAAYKELEQLKAAGPGIPASAPMAQFGGMETQALPSPAAAQQIEGLQSEVTRLQTALDQQSQNTVSPNREFQMQFSAMQTQLLQVRKELSETRSEKDRLIQEKEKALSQVDRMKAELEGAQSTPAPATVSAGDQDVADNLQKALNIQKKRYEDLQTKYTDLESEMESLRSTKGAVEDNTAEIRDLQSQLAALRVENTHLKAEAKTQKEKPQEAVSEGQSDQALRQAREMQYENETLNARIEKLQAVEKELASTRAYFTPLVKELQDANQKFIAENGSVRGELERGRAASENAVRQVQQLSTQNQQFSSQLQGLKAELEEAQNQITSLKSQLQMAAADREKYKSVEEEAQRLAGENKAMQKSYADLEDSMRAEEAKFRATASQISELQKSNDDLQSRDAARLKQVEIYRSSLNANLTDMKNLKSNFESYLESLVASFDERRK